MPLDVSRFRRSRIAIVGFCAGFHAGGHWTEMAASTDFSLRRVAQLCREHGPAPWAVTPHAPRFECMTERIAAELGRAGLLDESGAITAPQRSAISFAASKGRMPVGEDRFLSMLNNDWPARLLARHLAACGPCLAPVAACATGSHAIALAGQMIQDGHADVAVAGAVESDIAPVVMASYRSMGALSRSGVMRPFDRRHDGFVPGEGFGCLILENAGLAQARGAKIYGFLSGWSMAADATAMTAMNPGGESIARCIEGAMTRAGAAKVDYINAHGTATPLNDAVESRGIALALGRAVPVSSTKSLTGHLLGAAGAVEAALCLQTMRENYAPPTLNLEEPDVSCDLDYGPPTGRTLVISTTLSLSYGFGGHMGALVFERI